MDQPPHKDGAKSPRRWDLIAKLVLAAGGPIFGWVESARWVREHPVFAGVLLVAYEIGVASLGFFAQILRDIWGRIKDRWIDLAARWLDYRIQEVASRYRKEYLDHVFNASRFFDVTGFVTHGNYALDLEDVFVELSVDRDAPLSKLQGVVPTLKEGRHHVWEYLASGRNFVILGVPGSGKTTLLRHIARVMSLSNRPVSGTPRRIPVILYLRNHAKAIAQNEALSLSETIERGQIVSEMAAKCPPEWFDRQLRRGRCLVMIDGLDEIKDSQMRGVAAKWIERQTRAHRKNQFLVTSRKFGYENNPLMGFNRLTVLPFSPRQVRQFIENWYLANEISFENTADRASGLVRAETGARDLVSRILSSEDLTDLAANPLLLSMIATIHKFLKKLPDSRAELYRQIFEVFLGKAQDAHDVERTIDLTPTKKRLVIEPLAYHMMNAGLNEIPKEDAEAIVEVSLTSVNGSAGTVTAADFLKLVENSSGLMIEDQYGKYTFSHRTFREYLAATHLCNQRNAAELKAHVTSDWWHETIRLFVAQADATPILEACLKGSPPKLEAVTLAVECLEEAQKVDEIWRKQVERVVACEVEDPERQTVYGEALLKLRLRKMVRLNPRSGIDTKLVTQAEYQVFLDESRTQPPAHWESRRFALGQGAIPISGVRLKDAEAFCNWLERRSNAWQYRLPFLSELTTLRLGSTGDQTALESFGCWAKDETKGSPTIGCLSDSARQGFVSQAKELLRELLEEDIPFAVSLGKELGLRPVFAKSLESSFIVPDTLGLDNIVEQGEVERRRALLLSSVPLIPRIPRKFEEQQYLLLKWPHRKISEVLKRLDGWRIKKENDDRKEQWRAVYVQQALIVGFRRRRLPQVAGLRIARERKE